MQERKLSEQQEKIMSYIKKVILQRGCSPTIREIGREVGLRSSSSVHSQLNKLKEMGYIRSDPDKPRTIELIDDRFNLVRKEIINVPVLKSINEVDKLFTEENIKMYYPIPVEMLPNAQIFIFKMNGNSMINARIIDTDKLIVEQCETVDVGEITVAIVDNSVVVGRFYTKGDLCVIQPENSIYEPIVTDEIKILGRVIGLFRLGVHDHL